MDQKREKSKSRIEIHIECIPDHFQNELKTNGKISSSVYTDDMKKDVKRSSAKMNQNKNESSIWTRSKSKIFNRKCETSSVSTTTTPTSLSPSPLPSTSSTSTEETSKEKSDVSLTPSIPTPQRMRNWRRHLGTISSCVQTVVNILIGAYIIYRACNYLLHGEDQIEIIVRRI